MTVFPSSTCCRPLLRQKRSYSAPKLKKTTALQKETVPNYNQQLLLHLTWNCVIAAGLEFKLNVFSATAQSPRTLKITWSQTFILQLWMSGCWRSYVIYQWYTQLMWTEHVCAMTRRGERPSTVPPVCCCSPAPCLSVLMHANLLFLPASRTVTPLTLLTLSVNKNTAPNRLPSMPKL